MLACFTLLALITAATSAEDDSCSSVCDCSDYNALTDCSGAGFDAVPSDLPSNTSHLLLAESVLTFANWSHYEQFPNLEILDLSYNLITSVTLNLEAHLPFLTNLDLSGNLLTMIPELQSKTLTWLFMDSNMFSHIPATAFLGIPNMQNLSISTNFLTSIDKDAFAHMKDIDWLALSDNMLVEFPSTVFSGHNRLELIDLGYNSFTTLPVDLFRDLPLLWSLNFGPGSVETLPVGIFTNLPSLLEIWMNDCAIQSLPPGIFDGLTTLLTIVVDNNQLTEFPAGIFDDLNSLQFLSMSSNNITSLPPGILDNLANLTNLFLQDNLFASFPPAFFDKLISLENLDISDNMISDLKSSSLVYTRLQELYVRGNGLLEFTKNLLPVGSLRILDLRYNKIARIEEGAFDALQKQLSHLAMDLNPSSCFVGLDFDVEKAIYCDCAPGYTSRYTGSCVLITDVLVTNLPALIVPARQYEFIAPAEILQQLTSNCGSFIVHGGSATLISNANLTDNVFKTATNCSLIHNHHTVWDISVIDGSDQWYPYFYPDEYTFSMTVGDDAKTIVLPGRYIVLNVIPIAPHMVYTSDNDLPSPISLNRQSGVVIVTPSVNITTTTVTFLMLDAFTGLSTEVASMSLTIVAAPVRSSKSGGINTGAVIGGVVGGFVVLLVVLILVFMLVREHERHKLKPHNFVAMLAGLTGLDMSGERKIPREIKRGSITLTDTIGHGQFGEVSKGILEEVSGTPGYLIAAKVSNASEGFDRGAMLREAALMAQFDSKFVVRLVGVVTLGDPLMILLEYCEHGALNKYLTAHSLSPRYRHQIAADCAEGLAYLSTLKFVHRDVAARNVLVSSERHAKISDFGMSRETINSDYYRSASGHVPVRWSAPEALEEHYFSQQSDCWAFGVLLFEIWTNGAAPYEGMSNQKVWTEVVNGYRLPCPPNCPWDVHAIMMECWSPLGQRPRFDILVKQLRDMQDIFDSEEATSASDNPTSFARGKSLTIPELSKSGSFTYRTDAPSGSGNYQVRMSKTGSRRTSGAVQDSSNSDFRDGDVSFDSPAVGSGNYQVRMSKTSAGSHRPSLAPDIVVDDPDLALTSSKSLYEKYASNQQEESLRMLVPKLSLTIDPISDVQFDEFPSIPSNQSPKPPASPNVAANSSNYAKYRSPSVDGRRVSLGGSQPNGESRKESMTLVDNTSHYQKYRKGSQPAIEPSRAVTLAEAPNEPEPPYYRFRKGADPSPIIVRKSSLGDPTKDSLESPYQKYRSKAQGSQSRLPEIRRSSIVEATLDDGELIPTMSFSEAVEMAPTRLSIHRMSNDESEI